MADLGSDFDRTGGDFGPTMQLLDSPNGQALAFLQALAERLQAPRGAFWYDTDAGLDMRTYVADDEEPAVAAHEISQECLKDERCATCNVTIDVAGTVWTVRIQPGTADDVTYDLTFHVSASKIDFLTAGPTGA
jgi:hypothetical protein